MKRIIPYLILSFVILATSGCMKTNGNPVDANTSLGKQNVFIFDGIPVKSEFYKYHEFTVEKDEIEKAKKEFETSYYVYFDRKSLGASKGLMTQGHYSDTYRVAFDELKSKYFDHYIAVTADYNPYPREVQRSTEKAYIYADDFRETLNVVNAKLDISCELKEVLSVDLDADNKNEYILTINDREKAISAIVLANDKKQIIAYPTILKIEDLEGYYITFFDGDIVDVDNDNIMEILVIQPSYEGTPEINILNIITEKLMVTKKEFFQPDLSIMG